jgi:hypothetical protein
MAPDPGLLKLLNSIVDAKYDLKIRSSTPQHLPLGRHGRRHEMRLGLACGQRGGQSAIKIYECVYKRLDYEYGIGFRFAEVLMRVYQ